MSDQAQGLRNIVNSIYLFDKGVISMSNPTVGELRNMPVKEESFSGMTLRLEKDGRRYWLAGPEGEETVHVQEQVGEGWTEVEKY